MTRTKLNYQQTGSAVNVLDFMTPAQRQDVTSGAGSIDVTAAVQAAIAAAKANSKDIVIGPGLLMNISNGANQYGILIDGSMGFSMHKSSKFIYTSNSIDTPCIKVTADNVHLNAVNIDGTANATKTTSTRSGCTNILFLNCNNSAAVDCEVEGGHYGIHFDNTNLAWDTNKRNLAEGNRCWNGASSGIHVTRSENCSVTKNFCWDRGTDGIKTSEGSRLIGVSGNICWNNLRDGIDLFDGFIEATLSGNICHSNTLFGFEIKGTFDGSYTAGDYVLRDSQITGNVAARNGNNGFGINSVRNASFTGNTSVSNTLSGYSIDTTQSCTFTGNHATKNVRHGYDIGNSSVKNTYTGCMAVDNSWDDGVNQNGTYHGFNLASGCAGDFVGCHSYNGVISTQRGGQAYGMLLGGGTSSVVGCNFQNNISGDINDLSYVKVIATRNNSGAYINSLGNFISNADAAVNGYILFTDNQGVTRKLATIA